LGDDYFGYVAAFGAFTDIPFTTPQDAKNTWGYLAYLAEALGRLSKITPAHTKITYDDGFIEDDLLLGFVVNSTSVAGIVKFSEDEVALDDGLFEVLLVKNPRNIAELHNCVTNILTQNFNTENVTLLHSHHIKFEFDSPVQWTRDGEDGGTYESVDVTNYHKAVRIFV
jgi:diacylglycerol kinase family enzyme